MSSHDDSDAGEGASPAAKEGLVSVIEAFGGENLRDVWVLDQRAQEPLYLREDVAQKIQNVDVERYLDNERFGFVTRDTYNQLHYSEFAYTLRGFDTWELFRTFLVEEETKVGVLCSLDRQEGGYDYSKLNEDVHGVLEDYDVADLVPDADE